MRERKRDMEKKPLPVREQFLLAAGDDDRFVKSGCVHVFLSPRDGNKPLRLMHLGEALVGDVIPAPPAEAEQRCVLVCVPGESTVVDRVNLAGKSKFYAAYVEDSVFTLGREFGLAQLHVGKTDFWKTVFSRYEEWCAERQDTITELADQKAALEKETAERIRNMLGGRLTYEISSIERSGEALYDALAFLCKRRHIPIASPSKIRESGQGEMSMQNIARMSGFICREVDLPPDWKKNLYQPLLGTLSAEKEEKDAYVVCFRRFGRLYLFDPEKRNIRAMSKKEESAFGGTAWEVLRPFSTEAVDLKSVLLYCKDEVSYTDVCLWLFAMFLVTEVGLGLSNLNRIIYDRAIPMGDISLAYAMCSIFLVLMIANFLFSVAQNLAMARIAGRVTYAIQGAVYDRTFHMPEYYFRGQEKAATAYRIFHLSEMYVSVIRNGFQILVQTLFSLLYVKRMFDYSSELAWIGLGLAGLEIAVTAVQSILARRYSIKRIGILTDVRSFLYQSLGGISTLRAGGAQTHALGRYMEKETELGQTRRQTDDLARTVGMLMAFLNGAGLILFYGTMGSRMKMSQGAFLAFLTANSLFAGAVLKVTTDMVSLAAMIPIVKDSVGVLREIPEKPGKGQILKNISGDIVFSHVSYGYDKNNKILRDISVHIQPGEYIGIAGPSGCGKSTLIRLLLGFAKPDMGQIYIDGVPLNRLDLTVLRRRIGCVLQDGSLLTGTILQNIKIVNSEATEEEVWNALEKAGMKDDIQAMPLGLMTPVSEEGQTLSGGQKQRILIARAIVANPKILIFDEATSALDNVTQEKVIQSLNSLSATRVAVAHRLSTLQNCDRILVMDQGRIIEQGSYDKLIEGKGKFYEMVQVQQVV